MEDAPQAPQIEILKALPESFSSAANVNTILQLQGMVTAGYSKNGIEGFEDVNFPNNEKDLGGKFDSTGGQTTSTSEKLHFHAKHGQPTIMFAMQTARNADDKPIIARHNSPEQGDAVIVYLPFKIFAEAGINPELIDENGLLPKEIAVANGATLFPLIAKNSLQFLKDNIADFADKNVIIDGNYADGIQTALDMQTQLNEQQHAGKIVTIGTFHTHGINKFVDNAVNLLGSNHEFVAELRDFQEKGVNLADIATIQAGIEKYGLQELNQKYSLTQRLAIEATDNVKQLDAIMAVDSAMHDKLIKWLEAENAQTEVGFAINGFNSNVFNPEVLSEKSTTEINNLVRPLLEKAYELGDNQISDESLAGTNFITACRPESRKNSDGAIKAFVQWAKQNPDDKGNLILIGHAPENETPSSDQKKIIDLIADIAKEQPDIANRILLLPSMRSDAIRTILQLPRAVGLAASASEPWGIGAIEIMASEDPAIGSNKYASLVHVNNDIIRKDEVEQKGSIELFQSPSEQGATPESSQASFANAMTLVSSNYEAYKQRAQNLAPDIATNFQWESMVDSYAGLEDKILSSKLRTGLIETDISAEPTPAPTTVIDSVNPSIAKLQELQRTR